MQLWMRMAVLLLITTSTATALIARDSIATLVREFDDSRASGSSNNNNNKTDAILSGFVGQTHVVQHINEVLDRERGGRRSDDRPASFVFTGVPGVGKTYLAKLIARSLGWPFKQFDMANFKEPSDIDSLTGPRQGIVGEGALVGALRENPKTVILLDEIEKAHPTIVNEFLLSALGNDGAVQDKKTLELVSTKQSIWILTSNCFDDVIKKRWKAHTKDKDSAITSASSGEFYSPLHRHVVDVVAPDTDYACSTTGRNPFASQALLDRLQDNILPFAPFYDDEYERIAALYLEEWYRKMASWKGGVRPLVYWSPEVPRYFVAQLQGTAKSARVLSARIAKDVQSVIEAWASTISATASFVRVLLDIGENNRLVALSLTDADLDLPLLPASAAEAADATAVAVGVNSKASKTLAKLVSHEKINWMHNKMFAFDAWLKWAEQHHPWAAFVLKPAREFCLSHSVAALVLASAASLYAVTLVAPAALANAAFALCGVAASAAITLYWIAPEILKVLWEAATAAWEFVTEHPVASFCVLVAIGLVCVLISLMRWCSGDSRERYHRRRHRDSPNRTAVSDHDELKRTLLLLLRELAHDAQVRK